MTETGANLMTERCSHTTESARVGSRRRCPNPALATGSLCTRHEREYRKQTLATAEGIERKLAEGASADELLDAAPNNGWRRDLVAAVLEVGAADALDVYRARRATIPAQTIGQLYTVDGALRPR